MRVRSAASSPLDDFLAGAGSSNTGAERLQEVGALLGLVGVVVAAGVVVFMFAIARRPDIVLARVATMAGLVGAVGGALELAGVASLLDIGWSDALGDDLGSSAMMRLLGGSLVALGLLDTARTGPEHGPTLLDATPADAALDDPASDDAASDDAAPPDPDGGDDVGQYDPSPAGPALVSPDGGDPVGQRGAGPVDLDGGDSADPSEPGDVVPGRYQPDATVLFALVGAAVAVLSFAFDGHTVSEGPRVVHAVVNVVHVTAAGIWVGGVLALAVAAWRGGLVADRLLLHRFAGWATIALVAVALAGLPMAWFVLDEWGELTSTTWGRVLLAKTSLVAVAGGIGAYHHFVVVRAWRVQPAERTDEQRADDERADERRARRSLTIEAVVLVAVAVLSGVLTTASTV